VVRCASVNPDLQIFGCPFQVGPTPIHMRDPSRDDTFLSLFPRLTPYASGELIGCFGLSEPGNGAFCVRRRRPGTRNRIVTNPTSHDHHTGSDAGAASTTAVLKGGLHVTGRETHGLPHTC
jgi:alkylation response protein AidB-like acyl-CoA dehydrogenase